MKRSTVAWGVAGIGCAFLVLLVAAAVLVSGAVGRGGARTDGLGFALGGRVGVVDLDGVILSADRFRETLKRFHDAANVKAVVVRINSPGGGVAASQELNREIARFRKETKKPVVVSMESVAASGGYYTAVAADHIVANPGTITGSIGVIIQWVNYGDLLEWAKLRAVTIKSGVLKDSGNPTRPITDEDRAYFEDLIQKLRAQFVAAVTDGRKGRLKPGTMEKMADGRVVTGEEALTLGLVDEIGDYRDAVDRAARLAGMSLPAEVWHPRPTRPGLLELLSGGPSESSIAGRLLSGAPVGGGWNVFFLW
jgi:protease IV